MKISRYSLYRNPPKLVHVNVKNTRQQVNYNWDSWGLEQLHRAMRDTQLLELHFHHQLPSPKFFPSNGTCVS